MKGKWRELLGIGLAASLLLAACGKDGDRGGDSGIEVDPVAIEESSAAESASASAPDNTGGTSEAASPQETSEEPAVSGESAVSKSPEVSYETLRDARQDEAGEEILFAEYPRFYVEGEGHEALSAALDEINDYWEKQSATFLDETEESAKEYRASVDAAGVFGQGVQVHVSRCDDQVVCLTVLRTVQVGGPHPNNYFDSYNLNPATGKKLLLADVVTVDAAFQETILRLLHESYPEVEFDDESVGQEISQRLANGAVDWYFTGDQISVSFPEGAFGYPHAVGSLGVMIPVD